MNRMGLIAVSLMLALVAPSVADAAPRAHKSRKLKPAGVEIVDLAPMVRIREARGAQGLTPLEFARWLSAHPRLATEAPRVLAASTSTRLLNRVAEDFVEADRDGDGRISAEELADYVQPAQPAAVARATRTI